MFNPMNYMMPFYQNYGMNPMSIMQSMYPATCVIIYPVVVDVCSRMDTNLMAMPSQQEIDQMTDDVYDRVEALIDDDGQIIGESEVSKEAETSQDWYYFRRRPRRRGLLRDLTQLLLLRELFRRRGWYYYY